MSYRIRKRLVAIAILVVVLLWLEILSPDQHTRLALRAWRAVATSQPNLTVQTRPSEAVRKSPDTKPVKTQPPRRSTTLPSSRPTSKPATLPVATTRPAVSTTQPMILSASSYRWTTTRGKDGFWRVGKTSEGVWWFIAPDNHLDFLNTVTTVQPYQLARAPRGIIFQSRDYDGSPTNPGNYRLWAEQTLKRVYAAGFKGLGAWCHPIFHELPVPMTRDLNIWASTPATAIRFYDPDWLPSAETTIRTAAVALKDNKYLIGYFLDNELDFSDGRVGPGLYFDNLPADNPNRKQVVEVIRNLWPQLDQVNAAWGWQLANWAALDQIKVLPREPVESYTHLQSAWLEHLMGDYFRHTSELVRKYDPNHLVLGIRLAGYAPEEVIRASRGFTDVQSLNYYVSDALLDNQLFRNLSELSDQPVVLSEYSFHALDGRSGNRNTIGFAAQVTDQQARADAYRLFTTRCARTPWVIGADWFQWADEPPSGRSSDGEDVNFGVVDVDDREYPLLVDSIRKTASQLNPLHLASSKDQGTDLWRDAYTGLPSQKIPYLALPVRIVGELSGWPESARLQNIRITQTVGMERMQLPLPLIYMGWRPEGLYLGMEVYDQDVLAMPVTGRWWTRDMVEFWISTRPVPADQNGYNPFCHQFVFVPTDPALNNGTAGEVGQWHRPGDALKDNLVPHPEIQYSCRLLMDRYVVDMFIPASSLHGWDPKQYPTLAFNIHVRNYQHAAAYFWSAPKEVQTQLRPRTWGTLTLEAPPMVVASPKTDGVNHP